MRDRSWTYRAHCGLADSVSESWPSDLTKGDTAGLLNHFRHRGFLDVRADSTRGSLVCLTKGPRYSLATRVVAGLSENGMGAALNRDSLQIGQLGSRLTAFLQRLEAERRLRSSVSINSLARQAGQVALDPEVRTGRRARLLGLLVGGRTTTRVA